MDYSKINTDDLIQQVDAGAAKAAPDYGSMGTDDLIQQLDGGAPKAASPQPAFVPTEDKQPTRPPLGRSLDAFYDEPFKRRDLGAEVNQGVSNAVLGLPMNIGKDLNEGRYGPAALKTGLGVAGVVGAAAVPGVAPAMGAAMASRGLYNLATNPHPGEDLTRTTEDLTGLGMGGAMMHSGPSVSPTARQAIGDTIAKGSPKFWRTGSPLREWAGNLVRPAAPPATGIPIAPPPEVAPTPPTLGQLNEQAAGPRLTDDVVPKSLAELKAEAAPENVETPGTLKRPAKNYPRLDPSVVFPEKSPAYPRVSIDLTQQPEIPTERPPVPPGLTGPPPPKTPEPEIFGRSGIPTKISLSGAPIPKAPEPPIFGEPIQPPERPPVPPGLAGPAPAKIPEPAEFNGQVAPPERQPVPPGLVGPPPARPPEPAIFGPSGPGPKISLSGAPVPRAPEPAIFGEPIQPPTREAIPPGLTGPPPPRAPEPAIFDQPTPGTKIGLSGAPIPRAPEPEAFNPFPESGAQPPRPPTETTGPASIARQIRGLVEPERFRLDQPGAVQLLLNDLKTAQQYPSQTGSNVLREIPWHKGTSEKELAPAGIEQGLWDWIRSFGREGSSAGKTPGSPKVQRDVLRQMAGRSPEGGR